MSGTPIDMNIYLIYIIRVLDKYAMDSAKFCSVFHRLEEPHRHYHTSKHIWEMMSMIDEEQYMSLPAKRTLLLAALYHDCVYDPLKTDNEEQSVLVARQDLEAIRTTQNNSYITTGIIDEVCSLIMETKDMSVDTAFTYYDRFHLYHGDLDRLVEDGKLIRREFYSYSYDEFLAGRKKFLIGLFHKNPNLEAYLKELEKGDTLR